jgi:hypothetical protein
MRKSALVLGLVTLCAAATAFAAPSSLNFTGRLSTASGAANGPVSVTFTVYDAQTGGASHWSDTLLLTATNGLVFAELGTEKNPLDETVFTGSKMFLEIIVGGETLSPRLPINSTAYAVHANTADTLGGLAPSDVVTGVTPGAGLSGGGSGGNLSLSVNANTVQSRVSGTCAAGSSIRTINQDGTVVCQTGTVGTDNDDVIGNEVTGATDNTLTRSGAGTTASPFTLAVNAALVQSRVGGTCAAGSSIRTINQDGTVVCQTDSGANDLDGVIGNEVTGPTDSTLIRSGTGTAASPFTLAVNAAAVQTRVAGTCAAGSSIRTINQDGTVVCQIDNASACTWAAASAGTAVSSLDVGCPTGKHPISGACAGANGASVLTSRPSGAPADGEPVTAETSWNCKFSVASASHVAYALCCTTI